LFLPFSTILLIFDQKSYPPVGGFSATGAWQKWRFSSPQTVLWLIKHWFSASTFVVKIATFAKRQTVSGHAKYDTDTLKVLSIKTRY